MALNFANNNSLSSITEIPASVSGGGLNLISTQTASGSANLSFTSGIDSTYKEYIFKFINIHPSGDDANFEVNFSSDGGSNYNVTKTTTHFRAYHSENDSGTGLGYRTGDDLAQSTSYQTLVLETANENDSCSVGYLHLFDPSSTTFVKHFISQGLVDQNGNTCRTTYIAGYCNTTSAIDAVDFKLTSGNIDSGVIKLYGVS